MVNNFERVRNEIQTEAGKLAQESGLNSEALVTLVMEIVDLEDQHAFSPININQKVKSIIQKIAAENKKSIIKD